MSLLKVQLLSEPSAGWTPVANTIYIVKTNPAKVYIPVPSSQRMAYVYIPTSLQLLLSLSDDIFMSPDVQVGIRSVQITFDVASAGGVGGPVPAPTSPFSLTMVDLQSGNSYILTAYDSYDTSDSIVSSISVDEKSKCHRLRSRIDLLNPSYVWTFNDRFVTNQGMHYVDEVSYSRFEVTDSDVAYPSTWGDTASRAMDFRPGAYGSTTLHHPSDTSFYTIGISFGGTGDDTIMTVGRITVSILSGNLMLIIDGVTYPTGHAVKSVSTFNSLLPVTTTAISACHWVMLAVDQNVVYVIIDDELATTVTLPSTTDSQLKSIDTVSIPVGTTRRQYNGLFIIPNFVTVDTLICQEMVPYNPDAKMIKSYGSTCTKYATKVVSMLTPNGTEQLQLQTEGQQGVVIVELFASEDSQLSITHTDITGISRVRWVTVSKNTSTPIRYWIEEGDTLLLTTMKGSVSARTLVIGEH